jgi:hypothetical protein
VYVLVFPDPGPRWRQALTAAAPGVEVVVAGDDREAVRLIAEADAL